LTDANVVAVIITGATCRLRPFRLCG